jgi:hypothetical protein
MHTEKELRWALRHCPLLVAGRCNRLRQVVRGFQVQVEKLKRLIP